MFTVSDIRRFRGLIKAFGLAYPKVMDELTDEDLRAVCNGIGPDHWPEELRALSTTLFGPYAVCHVPHDVRYDRKVGTREQADREFYDNSLLIWKFRWGWQRFIAPTAIKERIALWLAYRLLVRFAKKAWED